MHTVLYMFFLFLSYWSVIGVHHLLPGNFQIFFWKSEQKVVERKRKQERDVWGGGQFFFNGFEIYSGWVEKFSVGVKKFQGVEIFSSGVEIFSGGVDIFLGGVEIFSRGVKIFPGGVEIFS